MKIYNLKTGKVTAVLETKQTPKLEGLCVSSSAFELIPGPEVIKLFMLNSTEQEISTAHKN